MTFGVAELADLLWLAPDGRDRYVGHSPDGGTPRVYGGQMVAQAMVAAGRAVGDGRLLHAFHGDFLRPARIDRPIVFEVQRLKDGASFTLATVSAAQDGKLVFHASVSFHAAEPDPGNLRRVAVAAGPEGLTSEGEFVASLGAIGATNGAYDPEFFGQLIERRSAHWPHPTAPDPGEARKSLWCRLRGTLGDAPPLMHQALIGYVSDLSLVQTAFRPRGVGALHPAVRTATLSHAMWFHAPLRADVWFHYAIEGQGYAGNRGLARGEISGPDGAVAVTVMQEGLQRVAREAEREVEIGTVGR